MDDRELQRLKKLVPYKILAPTPDEICDEIERLNNIIDELEEYLNKCYEELNSKKSTHNLQEELQLCSYLAIYERILNKLQELKGSDKE